MAVAPPVYVPAPAVTPSRFGLTSAATVLPVTDPHMRNGVEYQSPPAGAARYASSDCAPAKPTDERELDDGLPVTEAGPVVVYNGFSCRAVGIDGDTSEMLEAARQALAGSEDAALEHALWSLADPLRLMEDGYTDILTTSAVPLVTGLGILEEALQQSGVGVGVVHAPRKVAPHAAEKQQVESEQGRKTTVLGTRWSFGNYPNTDVGGDEPAAGEAWLVATGPVVIRRFEVQYRPASFAEAFDHKTNDVWSIAERTFVPGWDDRIRAAVLVTL